MRRTDSAVIGDVHGCADELGELLQLLLERSPDRRIRLVGDLLTKGPDPAGVVRILRDLQSSGVDIQSVCGNHDLQLLDSLVRLRNGEELDRLSHPDRRTIERLDEDGRRNEAFGLLLETADRIRCNAGPATVIHGGIDPALGLERTSNHELVHRKARNGERHWWLDYDGSDGLIVVGHKPVKSPVRVTRGDHPVAVNIDTGCVGGGRLTAYLVEADEFIAVESRQLSKRSGEFEIETTEIRCPGRQLTG